MTGIPHSPTEAVAIIREHVEACRRTQRMLRMVADWVADTGIYDPVQDKYAIRLPGDVVRHIRELADL